MLKGRFKVKTRTLTSHILTTLTDKVDHGRIVSHQDVKVWANSLAGKYHARIPEHLKGIDYAQAREEAILTALKDKQHSV